MKLFEDCEIVHQHLRGSTAVVIVGNRAIKPDEAAALLGEFKASFGDRHTPIYFSADGWQQLAGAAVGRKARPVLLQPGEKFTPIAAPVPAEVK